MNRLVYMAAIAVAAMLLQSRAVAADFGSLVSGIHKVGSTSLQAKYSRQLHQSVNAAVLRNLAQNCAGQHASASTQTFTVAGVMRLDGVVPSPAMLPDNAFTRCIADKMSGLTFPLPPGNQRGWPVAMQFDTRTGKLIYMDGDPQPALPRYSRATSNPWLFSPVPLIPRGKGKVCSVSAWLSVDTDGRISEVDLDESNCPAVLKSAALDAAAQWIYLGKPGVKRDDSMDVRLSFKFGRTRVRVSY